MNLLAGTINVQLTAGAIVTGQSVGVAGKPFRLFSAIMNTTTTGLMYLYNGVSASGTLFARLNGTTATGTVVNFEEGLLFPAGLYMTADVGLLNNTFVGTTEQ